MTRDLRTVGMSADPGCDLLDVRGPDEERQVPHPCREGYDGVG